MKMGWNKKEKGSINAVKFYSVEWFDLNGLDTHLLFYFNNYIRT